MIGRRAVVLRGIGEFALLVDRCGEVVDEARVFLVIVRRYRQHLRVRVLGLRVIGQLERRVRDTVQADRRYVRARIRIDHPPAAVRAGR